MAYADYRYYITTYLGTAIQEADFPRLSLRASSFLDYYTQGRAARNAGLDALKMACCAVAEQYQAIDAAPSAGAKGSVRLREIRGRTAKPERWKLVQDLPKRRGQRTTGPVLRPGGASLPWGYRPAIFRGYRPPVQREGVRIWTCFPIL